TNDAFPCVETFRRFARRPKFLRETNLRRYCCQDGVRDFILDCEFVVDMSVVPFRPELAICKSIQEPHRDSSTIAHLVETTFHQVPHPKVMGDILSLESFAVVAERGYQRNDRQQVEPCQRGVDFLCQANSEAFATAISGHIVERKHGNPRRPFGEW